MGIQGLLPQLKSIMSPIHIKDLKGQTVAVDTYSWLHKGALSCSRELCKGLPSTRHIDYCMHRVNLMRHYGVKPLLVFDGGLLPMKADQEAKRSRSRKENLERANEHESAGNSSAAYECYQKAVDISPSIAYDLIQVLKRENVDYIVAPYEADSQMTFLSVNNIVDAVVTEDSDLIPFGCPRIIFKMDKFGQGVEFRSSMLSRNKDLNFFGFTQQMVLETCIFSGCDYLQSLPGMGLKRAHTLIQNFKTFDKVIRHLRYNTAAVPPLYEESFQKALWTFLHQRVYDPVTEDIVHLTEISDDVIADCEFLGPWLPKNVVKSIALGDLDPITKLPFQELMEGGVVAVNKSYSAKPFDPMKDKKKICLPVQKNILTNYFCLASIEAKRKFKAPQVKHSKHLAVTHETSPNKDMLVSEAVAPTKIDGCRFKSTLVEEKFFHECMSGSLSCPERSSSLLKSSNELYTPVLASHKDHGCESSVDDRAVQGTIVRSNDPHKLSPCEDVRNIDAYNDDDHINSPNDLEENISSDINNGKSSSFSIRRNRPKIDTKKRKIGDENQHGFISTRNNAMQDVPGKSENLVCDISHLDKYSGIAEESMKRFVSVISAFSYTSNGSRASGLRAPLKKLKNNSLNR